MYIDGVYKGPVNLFARTTAYRSPVYSSPTLAPGSHTVRLVLTGSRPAGSSGAAVSVDKVTVR